MTNQYPDYDLARTKEQLKNTAWRRLLPVFAHVRLATLTQLVDWTGLDSQKVRRDLKTLTRVAEPGTHGEPRVVLARDPKTLAHHAWVRRGEGVYRLGRLGGALLRELGLVPEIVEGKETRPGAITQSLCILDVAREAARSELTYQVERRLTTASGRWVKPDVSWREQADGRERWHLVEVEQRAWESNRGRILERLGTWCAFFEDGGLDVAAPDIVMVFNRDYAELNETLATWTRLMGEVEAARQRPLPFTLRYVLLMVFLEKQDWTGGRYPVLQAAAPPPKPETANIAVADTLDTLRADTDFAALVDLVMRIYRASRSGAGTPEARYGIPIASLRLYRAWLDEPVQRELRRELERLYGLMHKRLGTQQASVWVDRGARTLLRHFGVDRPDWTESASFRFAGLSPSNYAQEAVSGDYRVQVKLGTLFQDLQKWGLVTDLQQQDLERALAFFLTAPFVYPHELRLVSVSPSKASSDPTSARARVVP